MKGFSPLNMELPTGASSPCYPFLENNREESQSYRTIVATLNADWRVIECRDGIQWILQRRAGNEAWRAALGRKELLLEQKEALGHRVRALTGESDAFAARHLRFMLPDWMEGGQ
jgi:hypothetical protein